jgi:phosphoglycolate phosphatase-like HAD superfamily hydrolase
MKLFIWDFHGVLEKNNERAAQFITNKILKEAGYKERLTKKTGDELYGKRWFQYFEYLLPHETHEKHMELTYKCFDVGDFHPEIVEKYIRTAPWAKMVLKKIAKKHDQILISNTHRVALERFLKSVELDQFFTKDKIFSTDSHRNIPAKNKAEVAVDYIKDNPPVGGFEDIIVVGDAIEEMNLAKTIGAKFYLYAHKGKNFRECDCENKIRDLRDIISQI